jgi:hypothetical protein
MLAGRQKPVAEHDREPGAQKEAESDVEHRDRMSVVRPSAGNGLRFGTFTGGSSPASESVFAAVAMLTLEKRLQKPLCMQCCQAAWRTHVLDVRRKTVGAHGRHLHLDEDGHEKQQLHWQAYGQLQLAAEGRDSEADKPIEPESRRGHGVEDEWASQGRRWLPTRNVRHDDRGVAAVAA